MFAELLFSLAILLSLVYVPVSYIKGQSVKGSHSRYVLSTIRIVFSYVVMAAFGGACAAFLAEGNLLLALYTAGPLAILVMSEITEQENIDDDNWFNGRWNKIKNGVKNFVASVQFRPATTTAA
jgi:hypothetical protein